MGVPVITKMEVYPVAGKDCMELNLSGAHSPFFTRNIVVLHAYYELDMEFHTFLAGCSKNLVVRSLLPAVCQTIILQESVIRARMGKQTILAHRRIYEAVARGSGSEAYDAMMIHLVQNQERLQKQLPGSSSG